MSEMMKLEQMSTAVVAKPIDIPFNALLVVPSVGHIPSKRTKVGFSFMSPLKNIFKYFILFPPIYLIY